MSHSHITRKLSSETGQTMPEYAVVMTIMTIAVLATMVLLSGAIQNTVNTVVGYLS